MDDTPNHWAFPFQGSGLPLSFSRIWSGSMPKVHIAFQELQAVAPNWLSGKMVTLHLDNSTEKLFM